MPRHRQRLARARLLPGPAAASPALVATSLVLVAATLAQNLALAVCVSVASSRHAAVTQHTE